jgi:hypothetical protein
MLAYTREQAAAVVGPMSVDSFARHVQPYLKVVRVGRLRLYPVAELERWLRENAERPLPSSTPRQNATAGPGG